LAGLAAAQLTASAAVYFSNLNLVEKTAALKTAGYLVVPNALVVPALLSFKTALYGGLFYTLSIGIGLSLAASGAAWAWDRVGRRGRLGSILVILPWLAALVWLNGRGISALTAGLTLLTPPAAFGAAAWSLKRAAPRSWSELPAFLIPLALLAVIGTTLMTGPVFVDVRDYLLWPTRVGRGISDFYYRYTLYPAEAFKSLHQSSIKTARVSGTLDRSTRERIETALRQFDYLPIKGRSEVDLELALEGGSAVLKSDGREIAREPSARFLQKPGPILRSFSGSIDRHARLRRAVLYSIMIGLPLTLYVLVFCLVRAAVGLAAGGRTASVIAGTVCLAAGLALLIPVYQGRTAAWAGDDIARLLESGDWRARAAGLKAVTARNLDVSGFPVYRRLASDPNLAVRYYLADSLGGDHKAETEETIRAMLGDPEPNVVCMALKSLGRRGGRDAVRTIVDRIESEPHWYVQWYGYQALRRLGWTQNRSN